MFKYTVIAVAIQILIYYFFGGLVAVLVFCGLLFAVIALTIVLTERMLKQKGF
ncbi:MAG: hypothetical protein RJQ09_07220 [Cyclobacteriaceae bacterium]